jgi:outer membrane autotransporter protein
VTLPTSIGTVVPEVRAAWQHEYLDANQTLTADFVSAPTTPFTVSGANYGRDAALVGAGVTANVLPNVNLFLDYDGRFNGGFTEHAVSGGIRIKF